VKTTCCTSLVTAVAMAGMVLSVLLVLAGCEADPSTDMTVSVSPQIAELKQHESQIFTASGGIKYSWSISSTNANASDPWGILSATTGDQVTYTSLRAPATGQAYVVQMLTVSATLGMVSSSNSVAPRTASTTAYIYHVQ
jgi:hypothetical protein